MPQDEDEFRPKQFKFDPFEDDPTYIIVETVAELEGIGSDELPSLYDTIDHVIDHVFSDPPIPEAQVQITFTYAGYRITLNQNGSATFLKISTPDQ